MAVIVVTHDAGIAARSHRLLRMRDGRIVEETIQ
jgi:predicted ABC-type transport system involved in lysophospholipase L1 biosynthesis ATPase subunit